ncbi:MAG: hypothetical protein M3388_07360 [Acidobacteriota bacterium]|nr:hypothetical protein [Acidobacteriota bacterium]
MPLFAVWRENSRNEAKIASEELEKGRLQVTEVMLGDTTFGKEDFIPEYEKAGGYLLTPRQFPKRIGRGRMTFMSIAKKPLNYCFRELCKPLTSRNARSKEKPKTERLCWHQFGHIKFVG